jgi:hypothetical protein
MLRILVVAIAFAFVSVPVVARADDAAVQKARGAIAYQIQKIQTGTLDDVRGQFTARLHDQITQEMVDKAKEKAKEMAIADLVDSAVRTGESIKVTMKGGRTLTTLVHQDGSWLADTIWFK